MDKQELVTQLVGQLRDQVRGAGRSAVECAAEAKNGASAKDKTTDSRVAIEYASMARAQKQRAERVFTELRAVEGFSPPALNQRSRVDVGAVVEIEDEESGEGRTFFLAPAGAGMTLLGPGGDGHLSVVTPSSPIGRAVRGRLVGDIIDVTVKGDVREWQIVYIE
ncbi:MAG: GreA/GreB family elongation factor [Kofleriaceae bacterium]|nr:GreA/GreB family elongation factor [Kofleriaceae bacterium]